MLYLLQRRQHRLSRYQCFARECIEANVTNINQVTFYIGFIENLCCIVVVPRDEKRWYVVWHSYAPSPRDKYLVLVWWIKMHHH